jgi:hypothetical protein
MRIVDIQKNFNRNGVDFIAGKKYVMPEDIEASLRSISGDAMGMSYPFETIYRPYKGEDLTNKKLMAFRTGGVGDLHWLSPVMRYLKNRYPGCFLRVASACREPLMNLPEIDELYNMPFDASLLESMDYMLFFQGIIESSSEKSKTTHAVDMFFSYFGIDSTQLPAEDKRPRILYSDEELKWASEE